jgi:hypothetical protein
MNKKYAVMLFETEMNLGISNIPNKWVNLKNLYFNDSLSALEAYANIPNPASQLVEANDDYELQCKMGEMMINYRDDSWLNENLYPYI